MEIDVDTGGIICVEIPRENGFLIAGPCSVESEEQILETAKSLAECNVNLLRGGIWKPRTRPGSFQGIGEPALKWLKDAGEAVDIPVAVEVASPEHVEACLEHNIDVLWLGARTTVNPFSVQAIADSLKGVDITIMVKNPINPDIELWIGAFERLNGVGIKKLIAIHRGFSVYKKSEFRNAPNWKIPIELKRRIPEIPVICDPSHICGNVLMLHAVAQEAMDLLFDGIMVEVHPNPEKALSDSKQQITPEDFAVLIKSLKVKRLNGADKEFHQHITYLRREIDEIDDKVIKLLAKRMDIVSKIGGYKNEKNISSFQPDRWNEILDTRINTAVKHNLDREFIFRLYQLIHEESIHIQEKC